METSSLDIQPLIAIPNAKRIRTTQEELSTAIAGASHNMRGYVTPLVIDGDTSGMQQCSRGMGIPCNRLNAVTPVGAQNNFQIHRVTDVAEGFACDTYMAVQEKDRESVGTRNRCSQCQNNTCLALARALALQIIVERTGKRTARSVANITSNTRDAVFDLGGGFTVVVSKNSGVLVHHEDATRSAQLVSVLSQGRDSSVPLPTDPAEVLKKKIDAALGDYDYQIFDSRMRCGFSL